jgi:hypothetical protein
MKSILDAEKPDLVVLNGDMLSCEFVAPDKYNGLIDQVVSPIISRSLPFAATFGNHDWSETCSTHDISAHMWWDVKGANGKKLSFTTQSVDGPVEEVGESNYYVPVYSLSCCSGSSTARAAANFNPGKILIRLLVTRSTIRSSHGSKRLTTSSISRTVAPSPALCLYISPYKPHAPFNGRVTVRQQNLVSTPTLSVIKETAMASTAILTATTRS